MDWITSRGHAAGKRAGKVMSTLHMLFLVQFGRERVWTSGARRVGEDQVGDSRTSVGKLRVRDRVRVGLASQRGGRVWRACSTGGALRTSHILIQRRVELGHRVVFANIPSSNFAKAPGPSNICMHYVVMMPPFPSLPNRYQVLSIG